MEYKMTITLEILDIFLLKLGKKTPSPRSIFQVLPEAKSMCAKT